MFGYLHIGIQIALENAPGPMDKFIDVVKFITALLALLVPVYVFLNYKSGQKLIPLQNEIEYLKTSIHRTTSKVNPESDRKLIQEAKFSVQILGINSLAPLHHCREELIQLLSNKNAELNIVLLDPESDSFQNRVLHEQDGVGRILSECKASIQILNDINNKSGGRIELRFHSESPNRSLLIIDSLNQLSTRSKMLINYYPNESGNRGYMGKQFLSEFMLERDRDSFYNNIEYFEALWNPSKIQKLEELSKKLNNLLHTSPSPKSTKNNQGTETEV